MDGRVDARAPARLGTCHETVECRSCPIRRLRCCSLHGNWTSQGRCSASSSCSPQPRPSARRRYRAFSRYLSASFRPRQSCLVSPCWLAGPGFGRLIILTICRLTIVAADGRDFFDPCLRSGGNSPWYDRSRGSPTGISTLMKPAGCASGPSVLLRR